MTVATDLYAAARELRPTLTTEEAAAFARVHRRTIIAWIKSKKLPAAKAPSARGAWLIPREAFLKVLSGQV